MIIKIKTIGSTYMAASGLNPKSEGQVVAGRGPSKWAHLALLVDFALELKKALTSINEQSFNHFVLKMGVFLVSGRLKSRFCKILDFRHQPRTNNCRGDRCQETALRHLGQLGQRRLENGEHGKSWMHPSELIKIKLNPAKTIILGNWFNKYFIDIFQLILDIYKL